MGSFLRKNQRALKLSTLILLDTLVQNYSNALSIELLSKVSLPLSLRRGRALLIFSAFNFKLRKFYNIILIQSADAGAAGGAGAGERDGSALCAGGARTRAGCMRAMSCRAYIRCTCCPHTQHPRARQLASVARYTYYFHFHFHRHRTPPTYILYVHVIVQAAR